MANKLSLSLVQQEYSKKYPLGSIGELGHEGNKQYKFLVSFKAGEKAYTYIVKNHVELWKKLNLQGNLIYKREYESATKRIEKLQTELAQGCYIDEFGFSGIENAQINHTDKQKQDIQEEIDFLSKQIENAILI